MKPSRLPQSQHVKSLIKKDGSINVHASQRRNQIRDLYHYFFSLSWRNFLTHVLVIYLLINFVFACFYFALHLRPSFIQSFFLSVETLTAIDYARVESSIWLTYVLMTLQAILGILTLATITGLFYARFSRPTARLVFSNKAIIGLHNGQKMLYFRVANERLNQIAEARMGLTLTKNEISKEGEHNRKFYTLKLERDFSPLFALSWTVRHPIDKDSPLQGMDHEAMKQAEVGILASLTGVDDTFSQPIMARHVYTADDIVYNRRFKDIIQWQDRKVYIDLKGIHQTLEDPH